MPRVTTRMLYNNFTLNIANNFKNLERATNELSSGKKLIKPSDDPSGMGKALGLKSKLTALDSLRNNVSHASNWLKTAENALATVTSEVANVITLSNQYSGGAADTTLASEELTNSIDSLINAGNSNYNGSYVFAGFKTSSPPFLSSLVYNGDNNDINMEIDFNVMQSINIPGSDFLATSMNPDIVSTSTLASLNKGNGVSAGSVSITDRAGNTATVDLSSATTIGDVVTSISNASGVNVTATINSSGNGINIADNNTVITGKLSVSEVSSGSTASDLGIFASRYGEILGKDLDPSIVSTTTVSELFSGSGMSFNDILITNGAVASGTLSFSSISSSSTMAEVINVFNSSSFGVVATINSNGTGLNVTSTNSSSVAIISDLGSGTTASDLGIGGKNNILATLNSLKTAFQIGDRVAIGAATDNLNTQLDNVVKLRGGVVGGRLNRLDAATFIHDKTDVDTTSFLSDIEDADIEKSALDYASYQNAYKASLSAVGTISNISLLDFLR